MKEAINRYPTKSIYHEELGNAYEFMMELELREKPYVVKKGDCLWRIAERIYGNGFLWGKLFNANRDKIKDPNLIYPGQILNIL